MAKASKRKRSSEENEDYSSENYWDQRYSEGKIEHEWYYTFDILEPLLAMYSSDVVKSSGKVLEIGCGDRPLINKCISLGFVESNLFAVDYSKVVIEQLHRDQEGKKIGPGVHFDHADARNLSLFQSDMFDMIIDKGTIDAMLSSSSKRVGLQNAVKIISEITRLLVPNGTFVLISHIKVDSDEFELLMYDIIMPGLQHKVMVNWLIKAHVVNSEDFHNQTNENSKSDKQSSPVASKSSDSYGTVYTITANPKRITRNSQSSSAEISFEVLEYSDGEEDANVDSYGSICLPYNNPN